MKSNNSDLVKLPADFMNFICDCQKLIQDVKHSQRYREECHSKPFPLYNGTEMLSLKTTFGKTEKTRQQ